MLIQTFSTVSCDWQWWREGLWQMKLISQHNLIRGVISIGASALVLCLSFFPSFHSSVPFDPSSPSRPVCVWLRSSATDRSVCESVGEIHHRDRGAGRESAHQMVLPQKPVRCRVRFTTDHCKSQWLIHLHVLMCLDTVKKMYNIVVCFSQIDPSQSRSAVLHVPYLLPCVCIQVPELHAHYFKQEKLLLCVCFHHYTRLVCIHRCITHTQTPAERNTVLFKTRHSQVSFYGRLESESDWKQVVGFFK